MNVLLLRQAELSSYFKIIKGTEYFANFFTSANYTKTAKLKVNTGHFPVPKISFRDLRGKSLNIFPNGNRQF